MTHALDGRAAPAFSLTDQHGRAFSLEDQRGTGFLAWTVAAILAVGVAKALLMYGRRIISGRQALAIERDMREDVYGHLLRLSFGFYDRFQTGQLMSRATVDLQSVRFFLGFGLIFFFQHVLTVVSVTIVLFVVASSHDVNLPTVVSSRFAPEIDRRPQKRGYQTARKSTRKPSSSWLAAT